MKDRIKKFYKDHEDQVNVVLGVTGIALVIAGVSSVSGNRVNGVFSGPDVAPGSTVFVTLRNGSILPYTKPEA